MEHFRDVGKWVAVVAVVLGLVMGGCAVQPYRESKIRYNHPDWDDATIMKVARRQVEPGMTRTMVRESLGIPDAVQMHGVEEKWSYGIMTGTIDVRQVMVFFVYFKDGIVERTEGDKNRLQTLTWQE